MLKEGRFKNPQDLAAVFQAAGVDMQRPIIASCGTGVTASVLALALHQLSPASQVCARAAAGYACASAACP